MLLSEVRILFKEKGFKLRVRSQSFGKHAEVLNLDGEVMPSIFFGGHHRSRWIDAIRLKSEVAPVFDDNTSDKIYGFSS